MGTKLRFLLVSAMEVPNSPPGFGGCPNKPPPAFDAGCAAPRKEPVAGVPDVAGVFVVPNKFGIGVALVVVLVARVLPNRPPGLVVACPNKFPLVPLAAVPVAGCVVDAPPKRESVVVPVGFEPNKPPLPREIPEAGFVPNRPPLGVAGLSADVVASAGFGGTPKENPPLPPPVGVGEPVTEPRL